MLTKNLVDGLLAGTSILPGRDGKPLSFPKDQNVLAALDQLVIDLNEAISKCRELAGMQSGAQLMLLHRIITWLVATSRACEIGIAEAREYTDQIVAATARDPDWMFERGLASLLGAERKRRATAVRAIKHAGGPVEVWLSDEFVLVELLTHDHLVTSGARARNCIGTICDGFGTERTPGLRYLRRIESGTYRLFMLHIRGEPVATLEYNAAHGYIAEYARTRMTVLQDDQVLPLLIGIFATLRLPLNYVCRFQETRLPRPASPPEGVQSYRRTHPTRGVVACPDITPQQLLCALATRCASVDLSYLPASRFAEIPAEVASHLVSNGRVWPSALVHATGAVTFTRLRAADFGRFETCGDSLALPCVDVACFPRLRLVGGDLYVPGVAPDRFPTLARVGGRVRRFDRERCRGWTLQHGVGKSAVAPLS